MNNRTPITKEDWFIMKQFLKGMGKLTDLSNNIVKQGWISDKQRAYMNSLYKDWERQSATSYGPDEYSDYPEEDMLITNYDLCVGEWGE